MLGNKTLTNTYLGQTIGANPDDGEKKEVLGKHYFVEPYYLP